MPTDVEPEGSPETQPENAASFLGFSGQESAWVDITDLVPEETPRANSSLERLSEYLRSVLTTPNLIVLAGSGTSKGNAGGPSMGDLWSAASQIRGFRDVCRVVRQPDGEESIENFLSRCTQAKQFLQGSEWDRVDHYMRACQLAIVSACTEFLPGADLTSHETFLKRMARRRLRGPRLKLFTTNYDRCFEVAAGNLGITLIDGFSFSQPRRYDPKYFDYDIVRRPSRAEDTSDFVEGVVQLYKLHGSVNWVCDEHGVRQVEESATPCLIFPASTKFEQTYTEPHLEMVSQFLFALRQPNTCLVTIGFGFNDSHLTRPVLAAVRSNPSLKLLAVDANAKALADSGGTAYETFRRAVEGREGDVSLLQATFDQFVELIPQLHALSPAEQIERSFRQIAMGG